eukprot:m.178423 g.178423  ORF g.178423 m.178423 type:complete len:89 (-) comp14925_c0_seq9:229-495(-)
MDQVSVTLTEDQQRALDQAKIRTRVEDEQYLRAHPEIKHMTTAFLKDMMKQQPTDVQGFAGDWFVNGLEEKIAKEAALADHVCRLMND